MTGVGKRKLKVRETRSSRLTLDDDGVLTARPLSDEHLRGDALIGEILDNLAELANGTRRPAMWFPRNVKLAATGWRALIDRIAQAAIAVAVVVADIEHHQLGAIPQIVDSLLLPVRVFDDEVEAKQWLLMFLEPSPGAERR